MYLKQILAENQKWLILSSGKKKSIKLKVQVNKTTHKLCQTQLFYVNRLLSVDKGKWEKLLLGL